MSPFQVVQAALTDVGKVRQVNEDSLLARADLRLWAVADGMGGHANGRFASSTLVDALDVVQRRGDFDADCTAVAEAIQTANAAIHAAGVRDGLTMGSTIVALLIRDARFAVFWAGDSRAYLRRAGVLYRLTRDHTQVQDMVEKGYLTAEAAGAHPMAHVLSRAVGVQPQIQLDAVADTILEGDVFMLCSDGLYGVVGDPEIDAVLAAQSVPAAARSLLDLCLSRGAPDNVSIVLVRCQAPGP